MNDGIAIFWIMNHIFFKAERELAKKAKKEKAEAAKMAKKLALDEAKKAKKEASSAKKRAAAAAEEEAVAFLGSGSKAKKALKKGPTLKAEFGPGEVKRVVTRSRSTRQATLPK